MLRKLWFRFAGWFYLARLLLWKKKPNKRVLEPVAGKLSAEYRVVGGQIKDIRILPPES